MSIRNFLTNFRQGNYLIPTTRIVSDAQLRRFLDTALRKFNAKKVIENAQATVQVVAQSKNVILPLDYATAFNPSLIAVEYGFSAQYVTKFSTLPRYYYGSSFASQIYAALEIPRSLKQITIPSPETPTELIFGRARKVLKLHSTPSEARTETLIYHAKYSIADPSIEITVNSQPTNGLTFIITGASGNITYTLLNVPINLNDIKIGSTTNYTANNIAAAINKNTTTTKVAAIVEGSVVITYSFDPSDKFNSTDIDFSLTVDNTILTQQSFPASTNLEHLAQSRIIDWVTGEGYAYLATQPSTLIDSATRRTYLQQAKEYKDQALADIGFVTFEGNYSA